MSAMVNATGGTEMPPAVALNPASATALAFIENTLQEVCDQMQSGGSGNVVIQLRRLDRYDAVRSKDLVSTECRVKDHQVKYSWPGKTGAEAWRFACAFAVFNSIHAAITLRTAVTKRDIFYSDPELFGEQNIVDKFIDDIAHTCQVSRNALFVTASPKGLFIIPGLIDDEPRTIPLSPPNLDCINWIMIVEKEASFKTLCESEFHQRSRTGPGMILTAKGYPDLGTRQFLRSCITSASLFLPIFGLFDYDPYGVDILKCYRSGSKVSAHEPDLNLPEIQWLGIRSEDVVHLPQDSPTLALSQSDRKRAINLVDSMTNANGDIAEELQECCTEVQRMLMLGRKAEIQILGGDLCRWAERKMLDIMSR